MFKILSLAVVLLIASAGAFALGSSDVPIRKADYRAEQAIAALGKMTDADSLAAAGIMSIGRNNSQSLSLLIRATAAAPDRADLLWLQSLRCAQLSSCDPSPFEHHLRELDPTNGAGWWGALARVQRATLKPRTPHSSPSAIQFALIFTGRLSSHI